jgi:hypothetical protein
MRLIISSRRRAISFSSGGVSGGASNMSDPTYLTELKKYGAGDPTRDDIEALEIELYAGPDRAAAVVLGALAENSLAKLIRNKMRADGIEELFKPSGLLGDFAAKIQIGYALQLFGAQTRKDLNIIRHLRNQFAHSRMPIEFVTPVVKRCCDELTYPSLPEVHIPFNYLNKVSDYRLKEAADKSHPRTRYFISVNEIAQRIYFIRGEDDKDPRNNLP